MPTYNQRIMQYKLQLNLNNGRILQNSGVKEFKLIHKNDSQNIKKIKQQIKNLSKKIGSNNKEIINLKSKNNELFLLKTRLKSNKYHYDKNRDQYDATMVISSHIMDSDNEDSDLDEKIDVNFDNLLDFH
eukprot:Pgem_evm2s5539